MANIVSQQEQDRRIDYIEFPAIDIERTKTFYSSVFGWKFTDWGSDYVSFEDGRLSGGFGKGEAVVPGGPLVVVYASNLSEIEEAIQAHGGEIVREAYRFPGGRRFHFADPDGNVLAVWTDQE